MRHFAAFESSEWIIRGRSFRRIHAFEFPFGERPFFPSKHFCRRLEVLDPRTASNVAFHPLVFQEITRWNMGVSAYKFMCGFNREVNMWQIRLILVLDTPELIVVPYMSVMRCSYNRISCFIYANRLSIPIYFKAWMARPNICV